MQRAWLFMIVLAAFFLTPGCNNNPKRQAAPGEKNSANKEMPENSGLTEYDSCYENFFAELPRFKDSTSSYLIMENEKRKSLTQFFKDEFMSPMSNYGVKDLDSDGVSELVVFNNTGGAHCCDEYYIFAQRSEEEYALISHIMGGQVCIDPGTNTINYSLSETFGYFFSCYACAWVDSIGHFKTLRNIQLQYHGSRLNVLKYDSAAARQNILNLEILQNHGYEKVAGLMDNGWRKEYALNFAIWHYNNGKNWKLTKTLFENYYTFSDAENVWDEFYRTMLEAGMENSF